MVIGQLKKAFLIKRTNHVFGFSPWYIIQTMISFKIHPEGTIRGGVGKKCHSTTWSSYRKSSTAIELVHVMHKTVVTWGDLSRSSLPPKISAVSQVWAQLKFTQKEEKKRRKKNVSHKKFKTIVMIVNRYLEVLRLARELRTLARDRCWRCSFNFRVSRRACRKTKMYKKARGGTLKLFCSPGLEYMIWAQLLLVSTLPF